MMSGKRCPMKSDVKEKKDAYLLEIDLPGCQREDIKAYIEDGYLYITASLNKEKKKGAGIFIRRECYCGEYMRSFYVGEDVRQEELQAAFHHGVLKITVPKERKAPVRRTISIEG